MRCWAGGGGEEPAVFHCRAGSAWAVAVLPCSSGIAGHFFPALHGITFTVSRIDVSAPVVAHRLLRGSGSTGECSIEVKNYLGTHSLGLCKPADNEEGHCHPSEFQAGFSLPWKTECAFGSAPQSVLSLPSQVAMEWFSNWKCYGTQKRLFWWRSAATLHRLCHGLQKRTTLSVC